MSDRSELEAVMEEDMAWRYIKMNIDTTDEKLASDFQFFVDEIEPKAAPFGDIYNKKLIQNSFVDQLDPSQYDVMLRKVKKAIEIYREKNIPLITKLQMEAQKFGALSAAMSVEVDGKKLTMQQAAKYLKETDRSLRKEVYEKIQQRREQDQQALDELYSQLIQLRDEVAKNADFANFRDYKFASLSRFDYTKEDCFNFHDAIAAEIVPIINGFNQKEKRSCNLLS